MDVLKQADRRVLWWALAAWIAILIIGWLWIVRGVEDPLDARAQGIDSFEAVDGATITFNGRDGYLTVPAGTANAEQIASDIADIRGVRDVEIEVLGTAEPVEEPDAVEVTTTTEAPEPEIAAVEPMPASFSVDWDGAAVTQVGDAPVGFEASISELGVASPTTAVDLTVGDDVAGALGALAPLVGTDLVTGSVEVDDDQVVIRGTAPNQEAFDRATDALTDVGAATVELEVADQSGSAQTAIDELLALDKIEFVTGTSIPTDATEAIIDEVAATLTEFPDVNVVISGHTDSRGGEAANQLLSEQRAQAVVDGLITRGVDLERLEASGKGESEPIDTNSTADGQQRNRRVEINVEETS